MASDAKHLMPDIAVLEENSFFGMSRGWMMYHGWLHNFGNRAGRWDGWESMTDQGYETSWDRGHGFWYQ